MKDLCPLAATLLLLSACGGPSVSLPEGEVSYAEHVEAVIIARCLSCHTVEEPKARLVLEAGQGYSALVGRGSIQVDRPLVVPGDSEGSYLWHKLTDSAQEGKGMPHNALGFRRLPEVELELIRRWIEDGARP